MELENRLNLYHVFQNLYDHHPDLLNELLHLESYPLNSGRTVPRTPYLMGLIDTEDVYLLTNVLNTTTQKLEQPQWVWTLGRAETNAICVPDDHLSRHHAAIQYIATQGFFLHDLESTNGTYLNHERVQVPLRLKEGDLIRIGTTVFSFFLCDQAITAAPIQPELAGALTKTLPLSYSPPLVERDKMRSHPSDEHSRSQSKSTDFFLHQLAESLNHVAQPVQGLSASETLNPQQRSKILDRFFESQTVGRVHDHGVPAADLDGDSLGDGGDRNP
ncbi:FHA domain-containing protein [Spirulina major CS-329]|uniref:FHA domain-containing protein n=1 Tax=Spirulina TaxID=1154 RepID=UPI00232C2FF2|nr:MULTISPECIES: FHA domain-containing protein [Spirulina]MDB9495329.1 FHA domain-containing protein [Spirulina subsalsa CS-330]MDB9504774.1 FHA domain-containing protein [Spirulina major CS-329]